MVFAIKEHNRKKNIEGRITDGYRRHQIHKSADRDTGIPEGVRRTSYCR